MHTLAARVTWLVGACLLVAARPARSQVLIGYLLGEKLSSPTFNMGFEIGLNFATLDGLEGAERINKTVFGLFADWRFSEHFHLGAAFLPIAGRGAQDIVPVPTGDPALDAQTVGGTMERNMGYIEFPVLLRWAPKRETGFRVGVGTSLGLITSATDRYQTTTPDGNPYVLEVDIEDQIPGFDFGLTADAEWRFPMLSIAARYTYGLSDLRQSGTAQSVYTRTLTGTGRIYLGKQRAKKAPADSTK
jgi:hypothetical protein